jgi:hypothetical protein
LRADPQAEVAKLSSKNTLALSTLVAALPAALLGFFLVGSFLNQLGPLQKQGTMYVALYGATLAACAAVVFLPVGVLIFGPRTAKAGAAKSGADIKAAPKSGTVPKAPPTSVDQAVVDDELSESTGDEETLEPKKAKRAMSTGELEVVEPTPSMDEIVAYDDEATPAAKASRKAMPTGELEVVEPTPSMDDLVAYDDEAMPKSGEIAAVDMEEDFAFDDEEPKPAPKPGKKKGK